jgi:predicted 3-demethylubiquinone-9 3-methyltransferase (glyoxalase superfamily)
MQTLTPFLWFNGQAEEAMNFYVSTFRDAKAGSVTRAGPGPQAPVVSVAFQLLGQDFIGLNGGPQYTFSPAISFLVSCETQEEVDQLWLKLTDGGEEQPCGWVKDRFGLSWQVVPSLLGRLLQDKDPLKAQRVMQAMLKMRKLEISGLQQAYNQD